MISLSQSAVDALSAPTVPMVQLLMLDFGSSKILLNTSNMDFDYAGETYKGAYGLGSISPIDDSAGEVKGLQFTMSAGASETISLALDEAGVWQSTKVVLRTAILDSNYLIVDAPTVWQGVGDTLSIAESDGTAVVNVTAESSAVDLLRGHLLTYSDADQRLLYPDDAGFNLIESQVEKPVVWPSRDWFKR